MTCVSTANKLHTLRELEIKLTFYIKSNWQFCRQELPVGQNETRGKLSLSALYWICIYPLNIWIIKFRMSGYSLKKGKLHFSRLYYENFSEGTENWYRNILKSLSIRVLMAVVTFYFSSNITVATYYRLNFYMYVSLPELLPVELRHVAMN